MERSLFKFALLGVMLLISHSSFSQITERERPAEWKQLVKGARFMDRFLPMKGNVLSSDTWGADCVLPRYVDNGIEDGIWSYWGGNIRKGEDGKYHLFVCGWLECPRLCCPSFTWASMEIGGDCFRFLGIELSYYDCDSKSNF